MFCCTIQGGTLAGAPDVCKTPMPPPVGQAPIPYPNQGMPQTANPVTNKVLVCNMAALTKDSKENLSNCDEAGVIGGVKSGGNVQKVEFTGSSTKVKFEGKNAVKLGDATTHNSQNAVGAAVAPGQTVVKIMG